MDFLKLPDQQLPQSNRRSSCIETRGRANSWQAIPLVERRSSFLPDITRWRSFSTLQIETTTESGVNHELLYKVTDGVLVVCATIFIICSVAYGVLWIYGAANSSTILRLHDIQDDIKR